jgi:hypothetical protein
VPINDGGAGLIAGVKKVYPESDMQRDVFHAKYELGKEVSKIERKAYSFIKQEFELKNRTEGIRPQQKTKERLKDIIPKTEEAIRVYDIINILYTWLSELLDFSGYGIEETTTLIGYILDEMIQTAKDYPGLQRECEKIRKALPSLLSYIGRLNKGMEQSSLELGVVTLINK